MEFIFGDGRRTCSAPAAWPGWTPPTVRKLKNVGDRDALYFVFGGKAATWAATAACPEGETGRSTRVGALETSVRAASEPLPPS